MEQQKLIERGIWLVEILDDKFAVENLHIAEKLQ
jgi:hypothetical protein